VSFLNADDQAERGRHLRSTPSFTREQIADRSREKARNELPRLIEEIRSHYRKGESRVTFVFNENMDEYDAEILARELTGLITRETGFVAVNEEASPTRCSLTVTLASDAITHEKHPPATKVARGSTPRFARWVIVIFMAVAAALLILFGMIAGFEGQDKDGEILVFSGVGMVMMLIVTCVLLFANDDSNHQGR